MNQETEEPRALIQIMLRMYVHVHCSETSRGATSPALVRGT